MLVKRGSQTPENHRRVDMTQLEMAQQALFGTDGLRVANVKLFPGSDRDITPERMAAQINQVLAELPDSDYENITSSCDD